MSSSSSPAPPTVVSLLLCDQVIDDKLTNKKSAIGLFNVISVPRTPSVIQQMVVLASVTEINQRAPLELRLVRDADSEILFHTTHMVESPSPLAVIDLVFALQGVQLSTGGPYAFELLYNGEILMRRRFQVLVRPGAAP
ncbi:hypothetical protein RAS1_34590 [Phycisphaerae bacterium RAS1]|nr:hypothetical protein RAS1_34590 [Phycisphaerae bacterium RAS1]